MKTAVITTGPGVMSPTATASRNWCSVSQWLAGRRGPGAVGPRPGEPCFRPWCPEPTVPSVDRRGNRRASGTMFLSLAYALVRFLADLLLVRSDSDAELRAEVLALRHQLR